VSLNAAALRLLAAKGLTLEDAAELAEAMEPARSSAAVRQANYRERKKAKRNGRDVTRDVTPPLNDNILIPPAPPLHDRSDHSGEDGAEAPPTLLPEHVLEVWNDMAGRQGLPKAKMTPERRRKLVARIRQHSIDDFTEAISAVERSPFLRGENDRGWRADFDFLLQPSRFTKLIEGTYDRPAN